MVDKSKCIMYTVNILLLLLGLVVAIVSIAAMVNRSAMVEQFPEYAEVIPSTNAALALSAGIILLVVSIVGLYGVCKWETTKGKCALFIYAVFLFILLILEIIAIAGVFVLAGKMSTFEEKSPGTYDSFETKVKNFTNTAYARCCPNGAPDLTKSGCSLIEPILTTDSCANDQEFVKAFVKWVNGNLMLVGAFTVVLAIVQICTFYASCCLLCRRYKQDQQPASV